MYVKLLFVHNAEHAASTLMWCKAAALIHCALTNGFSNFLIRLLSKLLSTILCLSKQRWVLVLLLLIQFPSSWSKWGFNKITVQELRLFLLFLPFIQAADLLFKFQKATKWVSNVKKSQKFWKVYIKLQKIFKFIYEFSSFALLLMSFEKVIQLQTLSVLKLNQITRVLDKLPKVIKSFEQIIAFA